MKCKLLTLLNSVMLSMLLTLPVKANSNDYSQATLLEKKWIHGSQDCQTNKDPAIEVFHQNETSFVLRQNKCSSYEAPFIYVLFGKDKILVLDTGATEDPAEFPLYDTVMSLNEKQLSNEQGQPKEMLVLHTHGHRDHYLGDSQFHGKPNTTIVAPTREAIDNYFKFDQWPQSNSKVDLGNRELTIIPTPGHQEEAITIYDEQTQWLLTGDTFYPGAIFVKHWHDYKASIERLNNFTKTNQVDLILGAHIEMTRTAGEHYPIGTTYQPNEAPLALTAEDLNNLNDALMPIKKGQVVKLDKLVIEPMGGLQKTISNIARWFTQ